MNAKDCRYIDKDKILPYLIHRANLMKVGDCKDVLYTIVEDINEGFFDWQQGSE